MKFGAFHYYERKVKLSSPDGESYTGIDSGCSDATAFLGYQSICLINCPFDHCKMDDIKENKSRRFKI